MARDLIFGAHVIGEWLTAQPERLEELLVVHQPNPRVARLAEQARELGMIVTSVPQAQLKQIAGPRNPQGIAARVKPYRFADLDEVLAAAESPVVLALDGITDPGNLGAIIRSASFFGVAAVILPRDKSASITPVVEKSAAGGLAHVPVCQVNSLLGTLGGLQDRGYTLVGTIPGPHPQPAEIDFSPPVVIIMGSEGKGIRPALRKLCDLKTSLRYRGEGTRSLNVSSFTGIVLYELFRPR